MSQSGLGLVETRFAEIVWSHEPMGSGELVRLCKEELGWKKSTTYTVLKKLCERGIFVNENSTVRALISRDEYYSSRSREFVNTTFDGSLPAFISAFSAGRRLSEEEVAEIRAMLDAWEAKA